ncbi:hypothetical protein H9P43_007349 [Blastocladiella emersonii ATCC 22665]|nr:hypothetical protein H9P43_007349 [Blastocladiella emersonii ATCC 22665]
MNTSNPMQPPLTADAVKHHAVAGVRDLLAANAEYQRALHVLLKAVRLRRDAVDAQRREIRAKRVADLAAEVQGQLVGASSTAETAAALEQWTTKQQQQQQQKRRKASAAAADEDGDGNDGGGGPRLVYSYFADGNGPLPSAEYAAGPPVARIPEFVPGTSWSPAESAKLVKGVVNYCSYYLLREGRTTLAALATLDPAGITSQVPAAAIDWPHVSAAYFRGAKSPDDCCAQWTAWDDPALDHSPAAETEYIEIAELAEGGDADWFAIASGLPTRRSPAWAFRTYHEFLRAQGTYNVRVGKPWTRDEDHLLLQSVGIYGTTLWAYVAQDVGTRDPKQCLQRWKAIDPSTRRGRWSAAEEAALAYAHATFGDKWAEVARHVPGRTDMQCRERAVGRRHLEEAVAARGGEAAGGAAGDWTPDEDRRLLALVREHGPQWSVIANALGSRADHIVARRYRLVTRHVVSGARADLADVVADDAQGTLLSAALVSRKAAPDDELSNPTTMLCPTAATVDTLEKVLRAASAATSPSTPMPAVDPVPADLMHKLFRTFGLSAAAGTAQLHPVGWAGAHAEEQRRTAIMGWRAALAADDAARSAAAAAAAAGAGMGTAPPIRAPPQE